MSEFIKPIKLMPETLKVKFKKLDEAAVTPQYAKEFDAAMDLTAIDYKEENDQVVYRTGLAVEIPPGFVGLIFPRSSISKYDLELTNGVGVIDAGFRGEITFKFRKTKPFGAFYYPGHRIGQLLIIPFPKVELEEVLALSDSERGDGGFGSSGA